MKLRPPLRVVLRVVLALTFLLLAVPLASAEGPVQAPAVPPVLSGQIGGRALAVVSAGNYAYVGFGPRLTIFNVSNPAIPVFTGEAAPLAWSVLDIAVSGSYAYVAAGPTGLHIYNIANPARPQRLGAYNTPGSAVGVVVGGTVAYVADGSAGGLRVLDVSNPAAPTEIGSYSGAGINSVAVQGDYAYAAVSGSGLRVLNVSDPAHPVEAGYVALNASRDVAVSGSTAYVAGIGLEIVNVANPNAPAKIATYQYAGAGYASDVAVAGQKAFMIGMAGDVYCTNVSDPAHPASCGYDAARSAAGLAAGASHLYIAAERQLKIRSTADGFVPVGAYTGIGGADLALTVADGRAYVSDYDGRVWFTATPNSTDFTYLGNYQADTTTMTQLAAQGNYLFVSESQGTSVLDVSDPAHATKLAGPQIPRGQLTIVGNRLYSRSAHIYVFDITNPAQPVQLGSYPPDPTGNIQNSVVVNNYVYALTADSLQVLDFADPAQPALVGTMALSVLSTHMAADENTLYIKGIGNTVMVVDVSNKAQPALGGSYTHGSEGINDLAVAGDHILALAAEDGVAFVDAGDPANPVLADLISLPRANEVEIAGPMIYVGADILGLLKYIQPGAFTHHVYLPLATRR